MQSEFGTDIAWFEGKEHGSLADDVGEDGGDAVPGWQLIAQEIGGRAGVAGAVQLFMDDADRLDQGVLRQPLAKGDVAGEGFHNVAIEPVACGGITRCG